MAVTTQIDGTAVDIINDSLRINDAVETRSTASFVVRDTAGTAEYLQGQPVEIRLDGTLIFGGVVDNSTEERVGSGNVLLHRVVCVDWHYLVDKRVVAESFTDTSAGEVANFIIDNYLVDEDITAGTIEDGHLLSTVVFNYAYATDALDALTDATGYIWWIDRDKKLHFCARTVTDAAFDISSGADILNKPRPTFGHKNPKYRNKQWIRGGKAETSSEQTESFTADGVLQTFSVGFAIAKEPTVTVDSVSKTVGIKGVESGYDCYWNKSEHEIYFSSAPADASTVQIAYYGQYNIITVVTDEDKVSTRLTREGLGSGIVEAVNDYSDITDQQTAIDKANALLRKFGVDGQVLKYTTRTDGLFAGQSQSVTLSQFGLSSTEMLITEVIIRDVMGTELHYDVTAITGPVVGSWTRFFEDLNKKAGAYLTDVAIGDNYILIILKEFDADLGWSESVSQTVYACTVIGESAYIADDAYIC